MVNEQTILNLISNAEKVYSDLIQAWEKNMNLGKNICLKKIFKIKALIYTLKTSLALKTFSDVTTQKLFECLAKLVGYGVPVTTNMTVYSGYLDTATILSPAQIVLGNAATVAKGTSYVLNLNVSNTSKYVWVAEPYEENAKIKWEDTVNTLNGGNIGTSEDLFNAPDGSGQFRFYITEYKTIFNNPIRFIKGDVQTEPVGIGFFPYELPTTLI